MTSLIVASRLIQASPEDIFDILATPSRHVEFDGSGNVQRSNDNAGRVKLGDTFGMDMKAGFAYNTYNEVVEYTENRVIAWRTKAKAPLDKVAMGRTWRYELEPVDGGTKVTETWDASTEAPLTKPLLKTKRMQEQALLNIENSLARLADLVEK